MVTSLKICSLLKQLPKITVSLERIEPSQQGAEPASFDRLILF